MFMETQNRVLEISQILESQILGIKVVSSKRRKQTLKQISLKRERCEGRSQRPPHTYREQEDSVLTLGLKEMRGRKWEHFR